MEIEHQIDGIVSDMRETISAIEAKVSPKQVAARTRMRVRRFGRRTVDAGRDAGRRAGRRLREHPLASAGLAAGILALSALITWAARRRRRPTRFAPRITGALAALLARGLVARGEGRARPRSRGARRAF